MSSSTRIGWFGLGSMGGSMALNLQSHLASQGHKPLRYSNRTMPRGECLKSAGAIPEETFVSLFQESDILFTMVSNDQALGELVNMAMEMTSSLEGKIWVDTSTVHPITCTQTSDRLAKRGTTFIASPVFGASTVAASGGLIFAMAGPEHAVDLVRPLILNVMGRKVICMGEEVNRSSLLKISGNILVIGFQELIAEGLVFAEKTGLGIEQMEAFIGDMFGPVLESYSKRMTTGAWAPPLDTKPGFAIPLAVKDIGHATSVARYHGMGLPTLETALARMMTAREYAGDSLDSSAVYGTARMEAGLKFWSERSRQGD